MKITTGFLVPAIATFSMQAAAQSVNVAAFLRERGAEPAELRQLARLPSPAVVPVAFFDKDGMAPSSGVLVAAPRAATPRYIDILSADSGSNFPRCAGITSLRAFRLQGRHYLAIECLDRDTRDDTYRSFHYVYDDPDYVSMFESDAGKHMVAIASVASDGAIRIEKNLSSDINRAGATGDIKAAKMALSQRVGTLRNPSTRQ
jgi:hypothetical protein